MMRRKLFFLALAFCLLAVLLLAVSTVSALKPIQITDDIYDREDTQISEKLVIWTDYRDGDSELYTYNTNTEFIEKLTDNNIEDEDPKIHRDRITWLSNNGRQFYHKNLTNGTTYSLYNAGEWIYQGSHDIYGDYIVYWEYDYTGGANWDRLRIINISGPPVDTVLWASDDASVDDVYIYKDKAIALMQNSTGQYIFYVDATGPTIDRVIKVPGDIYDAVLSGENAEIIIGRRSGGYLLYDTTTSQWSALNLNIHSDAWNFIEANGNDIIYTNYPTNENTEEIFYYRRDTGTNIRLTYNSYRELYPSIDGHNVAYISNENGMRNVCLLTFPTDPPDLSIDMDEVSIEPATPIVNSDNKITAWVHNLGLSSAEGEVILSIPDGSGGFINHTKDTGILEADGSIQVQFDSVRFSKTGTIDLQFTMNQIHLSSYEEEIILSNNVGTITVYINDLPTPEIIPDEPENLLVTTYEAIDFSAANSTDVNGIILCAWDFDDGTGAVGKEVSHHWTNDGTYTVTLTVYDSFNSQNSTTAIVTVTNQHPVAVMDVPPMAPRGTDVVLSAAGSYDIDGVISKVEWLIEVVNDVPANILTGTVVSHAFDGPGDEVNITLRLTDDDGNMTEVDFVIDLVDRTKTDIPPIAVIQMSGTGGNITFSGAASYDINGQIVSYQWTIEEVSYTGETVSHGFLEGTHFVTLNVMDDEGLSATAVVAIEVSFTEPPDVVQNLYGNTTVINEVQGNEPPTANASYQITDAKAGTVQFTGTGSDTDGVVVKYEWDFEGDGVWDYESTTVGDAENTYENPGYYTALFRVTDDNGTSAITILSVSIRTDEIGGKGGEDPTASELGAVEASTFIMALIVVIIIAIIISSVVAFMGSKKFAQKEVDMAADAELQELKRLVDESRTTEANVGEAEAIIRDLEQG